MERPAFSPAAGCRPDPDRERSAEVGLTDGITIPIHAPDALPASCSLAIGPDGVDPLDVRNAQWFAFYARDSARRLVLKLLPPKRPFLGRREREVMTLVAQSKTDPEIGIILISEHTVHNTVRRAMAKYGVASRIYTLADYVRDGIATPEQAQTLAQAVKDKADIVVAGGTGSGKLRRVTLASVV